MATSVDSEVLDRLVRGEAYDPHAVLGAHPLGGDRTVVRMLRPDALQLVVVDGDQRFPARKVHDGGVFEATLPGAPRDYRIEVTGADGEQRLVDDPYRWLPTLGDTDLYLIGEGRHEELWRVLGAHPRRYSTPNGPVNGVAFAVWAPNARAVRVIGDGIGWGAYDGLSMRSLGSSGVWELFVPDFAADGLYKYRILGPDGRWREKADPMAQSTEVPPRTASRVYRSAYEWGDADWLATRRQTEWHQRPVSIYEVHLGSWRPGATYRELADELVSYVTEVGFTHVEFLPVAEHPFGGSWGYQVTSYYAPTARFGSPDEFRYLVDRLHQAGVGVYLDWVPAHFPRDEWALARFDGTACYEHADPRRGEHPDWGTYVFDFGRREVRNFLVANALYWCEEFHVDGLRVDAVASMLYLDYSRNEGEWTPNEHGGRENLDAVSFLQETNATVYRRHPGVVMIAEESTAWPGVTRPTYLGGLGFGFKWNMGWMHDTLSYVSKDPIYRQYHHHEMTFSLMYAWSENFVLPISHDEVVHGKGSLLGRMPGDDWKRFAGVRALFGFMWAHPGKQLLFAGCEFAQVGEWSEEHGVDWAALEHPAHAGVQAMVSDLNARYKDAPALWTQDTSPAGFAWIDANDAAGNVFSFLRWGSDGTVVACVANFAGGPHADYRLGLPRTGRWTELLNTDAESYGGSGWGNLGEVVATDEPWHGQPASATIQVPPLATLWLRHTPGEPETG
ncbi:1,4-alpha-glucan branching protein GlgB [Actinocatenispora thailandica]|uniref:1,4-alpha-glucan branching protein GlgB n=1 Tax=Actinocatenispora thailandica TaxID=227318 RepID=UPI001EF35D68|nr:1,4-alpha-glucan branching protein GlgB [Actinocatenispora thailandica]